MPSYVRKSAIDGSTCLQLSSDSAFLRRHFSGIVSPSRQRVHTTLAHKLHFSHTTVNGLAARVELDLMPPRTMVSSNKMGELESAWPGFGEDMIGFAS